ncbi:hypothetical protein A3J20_03575 [Candidatus Gottesmanbacteria bacterium RIFCSPLOWO2_02_FULL_42_29]|uniref:Glycosyltransferase n=2 Tax=Candidatus Gottesmaniibacteriota TaxID=1752720 RepID=A0A1F6BHD2_9BACT|nr:MAG: hypothetical protein UV46_C0016G0008 [Candidatus Gottesmanbacteria bacterium GW2011_GWC2_42_8]OGG09289.1 MAG: hypothetical protein A2781_03045 [Candidatus Gottesmanbacteria bacterium RIFCSPHIGHO2_01_FULL_42_27]OGG22655.1 MAG: hypothetical protein A3E72_02095 [Candidatus Gottesmanbacteria bacterium RIFCSPHIGHO2_12_FULL_43_26]OGG33356.1 MAG: hypothetical protein A3G68_02220 [Candidatus Gottesmanbacteria bacterium RIFCSPLOWO2_12_FULL_42_10]OGG36331.1 MAG: hypothetical protein A2968_06195 [
MTKARIIRNYDFPDIFRQTEKYSGIWHGVQFNESSKTADYVLVCNSSIKKFPLNCSRDNIWCILQEPPNEYFRDFHNPDKVYARVFCQNASLSGARYVFSQPALPWHINRSYDELVEMKPPPKIKNLSFITSAKKDFTGQLDRITFLKRIREKIPFDLYGKGFLYLSDKWNGLAPYKYSLAIENYSGPYYWSEKLADCFLSFTMPIYYGCTNIFDYFPRESMVLIDINEKDIDRKIKEITKSNLWKKNREAIAYSRELILNKYQFFPYMTSFIKKWELLKRDKKKSRITIPNENTLVKKALRKFKRIMK